MVKLGVGHWFPALGKWVALLPDARARARVRYPAGQLFWMAVLMFLGHCGSRRQMRYASRSPLVAANLAFLSGAENTEGGGDVAHTDTMNNWVGGLSTASLEELVLKMQIGLIRSKLLDGERFDGEFRVAIDATAHLGFHRRHCEHCLTQKTSDGGTRYHHPVLEAKLVGASGFVMHLASVFIENPQANPDKQECELKAFVELAGKLKKNHPRLPMCLLMDGLYATDGVIGICGANNWSYYITLKQGSQPTLYREVERLLPRAPELVFRPGPSSKTEMQRLRYLTNLPCQSHRVHVIACEEDYLDKGERKTRTFMWITDRRPTQNTVIAQANQGGRQRWKIENQGFNDQKTGGYELEHGYGHRDNNHQKYYLLLQIAHLLMQLIIHTNILPMLLGRLPGGQEAKAAGRTILEHYGSRRNLARCLLEALKHCSLSGALPLAALTATRLRLSFDSS